MIQMCYHRSLEIDTRHRIFAHFRTLYKLHVSYENMIFVELNTAFTNCNIDGKYIYGINGVHDHVMIVIYIRVCYYNIHISKFIC